MVSQVPPKLVAMLLCDAAVTDSATGKKTLIGVFDRIHAAKFPARHGRLSIYFRVTDAQGDYVFRIEFVETTTNRARAQVKSNVISIGDRLSSPDFELTIQNLELPSAGQYEFRLFANDMFIGGIVFSAV